MPKVFVSHPTGKRAHYFSNVAVAALESVAEACYNPGDTDLTSAEMAVLAKDCDMIISYRQTMGDDELFAALPKLKAFVRGAIDIRNIDVAAASRHGILVTQASASFVVAVSEWVIGVMIDLSRNISASAACYHAHQPVPIVMGRELRAATLGVIGYGQISRYLCDLALAFGMRIVVSDPNVKIENPKLEALEFTQLLQCSDYVVCLAVATPETENLMNAESFAAMKPGAFFINASRGNLVNEDDLLAALTSGALAGCALDVGRAPDQMPSPHLAEHSRVIATPHVAGLTRPSADQQALETVAQVAALFQGHMPVGAVNSASAFRWQQAYCQVLGVG